MDKGERIEGQHDEEGATQRAWKTERIDKSGK